MPFLSSSPHTNHPTHCTSPLAPDLPGSGAAAGLEEVAGDSVGLVPQGPGQMPTEAGLQAGGPAAQLAALLRWAGHGGGRAGAEGAQHWLSRPSSYLLDISKEAAYAMQAGNVLHPAS